MIIHETLPRWKELFLERKEQNKRAGGIAKDAAEGRLRIEAEQRYFLCCFCKTDSSLLMLRFQLSKEERDALDQVPDGTKTMEQLAKHRCWCINLRKAITVDRASHAQSSSCGWPQQTS